MIDYLTILLSTSAKSEMLAQRDPYGFIMTVTAVAVVFGALLVLYVFFGILGGFNSGKIEIKKWFRPLVTKIVLPNVLLRSMKNSVMPARRLFFTAASPTRPHDVSTTSFTQV